MRARIPYLAGLARQAEGRPTLRPPHQLFSGASYTPGRDGTARRPPRGIPAYEASPAPLPSDSGEEPPASPRIASPRGEDTGGDRVGRRGSSGRCPWRPGGLGRTGARRGRPGGTRRPRRTGARRGRPGGTRRPRRTGARRGRPGGTRRPRRTGARRGRPGRPRVTWPPGSARASERAGPAQVAPRAPLAPRTESAPAGGAAPVTPLDAGLVPHPVRPLLSPESWTGTQRGTPVKPPRTIEPVPVTGETDRRRPPPAGAVPAALASGPRPAEPAAAGSHRGPPGSETGVSAVLASGPGPGPGPGPEPVGAAGPHRDLAGGETGISVTRGPRDAAGDPGRSRGPAPAGDLVPPPASAPRPIEMPGPEPGASRHEPRVSGTARVSIGTIEVTVVPPARPAPPASEIQPPAQVTPGGSRPPSLLAAGAGADRLRDGLRRWYGTAQG